MLPTVVEVADTVCDADCSMFWTDFHNFFSPNGRYLREFSRSSFSDSSRDVAMATNFVAKLWQNYLPPALIALAFWNGTGYRYLNVRVNSANDASISCKNFVNFGIVTSEKTGLICELFLRHRKKTGIFSRISHDILDQYLQSLHHMKAVWVLSRDMSWDMSRDIAMAINWFW